ncbi:putative ribonuclease H-like domain-containing protein [Tanacetum coccineum]
MKFNNKDAARFDKGKVKCYKCSELGHFARECTGKQVDSKARYSSFKLQELNKGEETKALLSVDSMVNWSDHEGEDVEIGAAQVYEMIAGAEEDATGNATGDVADDDFGVTFGSDEVFDLSAPSIFDSSPKDVAEKPIHDRFVKTVGMHVVPPPLTGTFMPPSNNPDLDGYKVYLDSETTDFASCVSSVKSSSSKTNEPLASTPSSVDFKTMTETADQQPSSTKDNPSFSFKENVKPPRNLSASVPAGSRNRQTSVPAGSRNRPTSVPTGRTIPAGLKNTTARPMTRPTSHYFQHFRRSGYYNQLNMDEGRWGTAENPHKNRDLRIVDSGCSRSMTGNKEKLDDFVKIVGGTVTFGGGDGKITGKGTIRTSKLNFENVYYVEELQNFNLFSVSQICDTKNKVLFTDKECLVLSKEFQLPENSQVVLRIPRRHNLYYFNLSDIQPEKDVTCLLAKASLEESTKWHRRMAHRNSKHKASYKAITAVSTIFAPLQLLHMDLFGPTSIRSIDYKYYSLVVTDDFSRSKGIRMDYSNARTSQQNRVAERKNRSLIEAARTMLADSMLPTMKVPNISHLKPFGCLVTILNTSDHLGKFEGKADEGFIVGYAAHSKAYRVYNLSSKKIEETLNLRYLEDKPNVKVMGHEWYFDLDYLTDSLGYTRFKTNQPAGTQDNNIHACTQADSDSECDETSHVFMHVELAMLQKQAYEANATAEKHLSQANLATSRNRVPAGKVVSAAGVTDGPTDPSTPMCTTVHTDATSIPPGHSLGSSEHSSRYPSPSNLANSMSTYSEMEDIHHHPDFGIFTSSLYDDDFGGTVTNLAPSIVVDSIPTKRVNTIHPQSQILGDLTSPVQTRGTLQKSKFGASAFVSYVHAQQRNNHTDYLHCLFACFLSQLEPSSVAQALNDPAWIEAMQEEMQQFVNQEILKNKRDARGIVVRNKARLVAQGHRQEEGIDYDEVFAPVARIEAIRLFLAFASYMGFMVYQMDVKSAFLYGEIEEEVFVTQPKGFEDPHFPKHLCRVVKALRGTIDKTLFIKKNSRDIILVQVYVDDIIFGSTNKAWCDEFEVLMKGEFEMSAMGELTFFLGLQVTQKPDGIFISQDKYVQDILKKFDMESILDRFPYVFDSFKARYSVCSDRKSTTGGCQFLGRRLISWQCKKQTIVATSSTEAEYVAAANCCGQVLKIHTDENVADLLTKAFDGPRFLHLVVHIGMLNP